MVIDVNINKLLKEECDNGDLKLSTVSLFQKVYLAMKMDRAIEKEIALLDYAIANHESYDLNDEMIPHVYLDAGSEGCYVNIFMECEEKLISVGTLKTLQEGIHAWRAMGILAGEFSYLASQYLFLNL